MKLLPMTLTCALLGVAGTAFAQAVAPTAADDIERGRLLYMSNGCFSCHGTVGQGGERSAAPHFAPDPFPFEAFKVMLRQPRGSMPRLDVRFVSDEQLQAMHRYLASIPKGLAAKDIPRLNSSATTLAR